jgi:hypothetical protein
MIRFFKWLKELFFPPTVAEVRQALMKADVERRCKEYQDTVNSRLAWNMANADLYKPGEFGVISVSYEKTSKGKTRQETTVLGAVPKADITKLIVDVEFAWSQFVNRLFENNKPAPSITNLEFISYVPYIGWRRGEYVITDIDTEKKHGRIDSEKAFKQLKSL